MKHIMAVLIILAMITPGFAKRMPKVFPATHDSVLIENERADALGLNRYETMREVNRAIEAGDLVPLTARCDRRLPKNRRYARPQTVLFVETLDGEFYEATGGHLVVDSAVRSADVQKRLRRRNRNAAPAIGASASSHERGTTVDLSRKMSKAQYRWLVVRLAFYEARGRIHIIEERGCFHIFVGKEPDDETVNLVNIEIDYRELGPDSTGSGDGIQLQENPVGHGPDTNRVTTTCGDTFDDFPVGGCPVDTVPVRPVADKPRMETQPR